MMLYLVLGDDEPRKQTKIAELKAKHLRSADASQLDFETLYADRCNGQTLKKALLSLPAVSTRRVLLIRNSHKFKAELTRMIQDLLPELKHLVLILEGTKTPFKGRARKAAADIKIQTFDYSLPEGCNVFNMTEAISTRQPTKALSVLAELMEAGQHPLQIMGGLLWFWKKMQRRLRGGRYEKGLRYMQEADINIKRSRLKPGQALEILVVQLTALFS